MSNRRLTIGLVGGALGIVVGLLIGLAVVRNDEATPPRTELVPVSIPTLSTTVAPTPPTDDAPLAVAPSDTTPDASTTDSTSATTTTVGVDLSQCEDYFTRPEGLPVQKCDRNETVRTVQEMLQSIGYQISTDGVFGPGTARAVIAFQSTQGLTPDGVVDDRTFTALCTAAPFDYCGDA